MENLPATLPKQRVVLFDEGGNPVVTVAPLVTKQQVHNLFAAVAGELYEPNPLDPAEAEYKGLSNIEVMVRKKLKAAARTGDLDAVEDVLDRLVGKPKSSSEIVKTDLTYEDHLAEIARKEQERVRTATVVREQAPAPPVVVIPDGDDIFR